eukprot:COSAG04_NODE_557_length_12649_cov_45.850251_2_plen_114_part_00
MDQRLGALTLISCETTKSSPAGMIADTDTGAVDSPCGPITTLVTVALALAVKLLSSVVSAVTIAPPSLVSAPSPAAAPDPSVLGSTEPSTAAEAKTPCGTTCSGGAVVNHVCR